MLLSIVKKRGPERTGCIHDPYSQPNVYGLYALLVRLLLPLWGVRDIRTR